MVCKTKANGKMFTFRLDRVISQKKAMKPSFSPLYYWVRIWYFHLVLLTFHLVLTDDIYSSPLTYLDTSFVCHQKVGNFQISETEAESMSTVLSCLSNQHQIHT